MGEKILTQSRRDAKPQKDKEFCFFATLRLCGFALKSVSELAARVLTQDTGREGVVAVHRAPWQAHAPRLPWPGAHGRRPKLTHRRTLPARIARWRGRDGHGLPRARRTD